MFKAFLIDNDDTLTRNPDHAVYHRATYAAYCHLSKSAAEMPFDEFSTMHINLYETGACHFTGFADHFGLQPLDVFQAHHEHMDMSAMQFDTASAPILDSIQDRAVILTDGSRDWAQRCTQRIGHHLDILARDDTGGLGHRKSYGADRWYQALEILRRKTGLNLKPWEVAKIDDSATVLRQAQKLGFGTVHCHWGHPSRAPTTEFDFSIGSVGDFLVEQGYAPALASPQSPQSRPAPAA